MTKKKIFDDLQRLTTRALTSGDVDLAEVLQAALESAQRGDAWLVDAAKKARPYLAKLNRGNRESPPGRASDERDWLCRGVERDLRETDVLKVRIGDVVTCYEGERRAAVLFLRRLRTKPRFCQETRVPLDGPLRAEDIEAVANALGTKGDDETKTRAALRAIGYAKWKNAFAHRDKKRG